MKSYAKDDPDVILAIRKLMTHEMKIMGNSNNFPKKFRHNIVDNILNSTYEMMKSARKAYNQYDKTKKIANIENAIDECEMIKDILPCVIEVLHPECSVNYWNNLLDATLKQLKDWKKSIEK